MERPIPPPKANLLHINTASRPPPIPPRPPIDAWVPYIHDTDDAEYHDSRSTTPIGRQYDRPTEANTGVHNDHHYHHHIPNPYDRAYNMNGQANGQTGQFLSAEPYTPVWNQPQSLYPNYTHAYGSSYGSYANITPSNPPPLPPPVPPKPPRRPASADEALQTIKFPEAHLPSYQPHNPEPYSGPGSSYTAYSEYPSSAKTYEASQSSSGFNTEQKYDRKPTFDDYPDDAFEQSPTVESFRAPSLSAYNRDGASYRAPEPQLHRSVSYQEIQRPPVHRTSYSEDILLAPGGSQGAALSRADSYASVATASTVDVSELAEEISSLTLDTPEGMKEALIRFQAGKLASADDEWYRLVPESFREALSKDEVLRQSILFEILKSERDYVADMHAVNEVYIQPLRQSQIIPAERLEEFISETFFNLNEILSFHQRMLEELFALQMQQHPIIHSISRIVLEYALKFHQQYESYIKHSPLAEAKHRSEMTKNTKYEAFVKESLHDPRIKKRELVSFILRPVRRLPQLRLQLESVLKRTKEDSEDVDYLQTIIGVLGDCVKASQPGIQAAESKVKFWTFVENMIFTRDEIVDLNTYDDSRSLIHEGTLSRRQRSEFDWSGWYDYHVVLLDHYLIITRKVQRSNGGYRYYISSRPIPLAYLGIDRFDLPPESRKEKPEDGGGILDSLRFSNTVQMYPFTIYHTVNKADRTYTFYASSESARKKWYDAILDALSVYNVKMEANRWFVPSTVNDGTFRLRTVKVPASSRQVFTSRVLSAVTFVSGGKSFLAVGTPSGIYLGNRGQLSYKKVLDYSSATTLIALQDHNKFLIFNQEQGTLLSYSLDMLARVFLGQSQKDLENTRESISDRVIFFHAGIVNNRTLVMYATTRRFSSKTTFNIIEPIREAPRQKRGQLLHYQHVSDSFYVPADAYGVTFLMKTVAIAMDKSVAVVKPDRPGDSMVIVPDFSSCPKEDQRIEALKAKCEEARALGIIRVSEEENMVIYQEFGCYITRHGLPRRNANHVRWESKATDYAHRAGHVLLFSERFVEIRQARSGLLEQVISGQDIRMLSAGIFPGAPLLLVRRGKKNDMEGQSEEILELIETTELPLTRSNDSPTTREDLFQEWE